jgi:hypothetical protein
MGTTLTGTTPQDTYDSLIKVTDNGPISGTAKFLSDGLGNDSALALSTANIGIGTTSPNLSGGASGSSILTISASASARNGILELNGTRTTLNDYVAYVRMFNNGAATPVADIAAIRGSSDTTGSLTLSTSNAERMRITSDGNVGIGTDAPNTQLEVSIAASVGGVLRLNNARTALFDGDVNGSIQFSNNEASGGSSGVRSEITSLLRDVAGKSDLVFTTASSNGAATEKVRILADGGLTFNGDTAAANALDDYEEGTWTMTATPQSSGTITLGTNGGTYTKIGRQVTCTGRAIVSAVSSPVGSYVQFGGLPFTSLNLVSAQSAPSVYFADASASYASSSIASYLPNNLTVFYAFKDASTVAANDEFAFTITYFV